MDDERQLMPEALAALSEVFSLTVADGGGADRLAQVRRYLVGQITALLDRNPARLMSILYRVDVAEPAVKRAFAESSPADLPEVLAELLIQRQLQKVRLRRRYPAGRQEDAS